MMLQAEELHDMKTLIATSLLLFLSSEWVFAAAAPSVVWVHPAGMPGGCSTREATLQAAIDRVADGGSVHILSGVEISGDAARGVIDHKEVSIHGGFQNCVSLNRNGFSVLDGSAATTARPLIQLNSTDGELRDIMFSDMELTGNDFTGGRSGALQL